ARRDSELSVALKPRYDARELPRKSCPAIAKFWYDELPCSVPASSVAASHARPRRSRTRVLRPVRLLGDARRAELDRLQQPPQHGLLQRAVRPRGRRGV